MKRYEKEQFSTFTYDRIVTQNLLECFEPSPHFVITFITIQFWEINSSGASGPRTIVGGKFLLKILKSSLNEFCVNECWYGLSREFYIILVDNISASAGYNFCFYILLMTLFSMDSFSYNSSFLDPIVTISCQRFSLVAWLIDSWICETEQISK